MNGHEQINQICIFCGEIIKELFHNSRKDIIWHEDCFKCTACHKTLTSNSCFLSHRKHLYCQKHYDYESQNCHENLLRELQNFKVLSLLKLETNNVLARPKIPPLTYDCLCVNKDFLIGSEEYWIECVSEECPYFSCYQIACSKANFEIPYWKLSTIHSEGHFHIDFFEEELYEICFIDDEHTNYYTVDEKIGPIVLSIKHEFITGKGCYRLLLRSSSHIVEGVLPLSSLCCSKYMEKTLLDIIAKELALTSCLRPFADPIPPHKLKSLDKVILKNEIKVGVIYIKKGQTTEDEFFTNTEHENDFEVFLNFLGNKVKLKGFKQYNGGLDTVHNLTGIYSLFAQWKNYQVMFHVVTMLPMEEHDDLKLQRKRHIGNDIVSLVFLSPGATFDLSSVRSNFLHVYIIVQPQYVDGCLFYKVAVATRNSVTPFGPPLPASEMFKKNDFFHDWLFAKTINGERASYKSAKFFAMQERTRRQLLEELVHEQACKDVPISKLPKSPFQRLWPLRTSSHRSTTLSPCGMPHSKSASQLHDLSRQKSEDSFKVAFPIAVTQYHDVFFNFGPEEAVTLPGVRSLLAARSRVFHQMLFCHSTPPLTHRRSLSFQTSDLHLSVPNTHKRWSELWKKSNFSHSTDSNSKSLDYRRDNRAFPNQFTITDFDWRVFKALLDYIHTGTCFIHKDILVGLSCAGEYYQLTELVQLSEECCADVINPNNVCLLLSICGCYVTKYDTAKVLQCKLLNYISLHAEEVFDSFDVASLSEDSFRILVSLKLKVSNMRKFQIIRRWYTRWSSIGFQDKRMKTSLLRHLDLTRMSAEDLLQMKKSDFLPEGFALIE